MILLIETGIETFTNFRLVIKECNSECKEKIFTLITPSTNQGEILLFEIRRLSTDQVNSYICKFKEKIQLIHLNNLKEKNTNNLFHVDNQSHCDDIEEDELENKILKEIGLITAIDLRERNSEYIFLGTENLSNSLYN